MNFKLFGIMTLVHLFSLTHGQPFDPRAGHPRPTFVVPPPALTNSPTSAPTPALEPTLTPSQLCFSYVGETQDECRSRQHNDYEREKWQDVGLLIALVLSALSATGLSVGLILLHSLVEEQRRQAAILNATPLLVAPAPLATPASFTERSGLMRAPPESVAL